MEQLDKAQWRFWYCMWSWWCLYLIDTFDIVCDLDDVCTWLTPLVKLFNNGQSTIERLAILWKIAIGITQDPFGGDAYNLESVSATLKKKFGGWDYWWPKMILHVAKYLWID